MVEVSLMFYPSTKVAIFYVTEINEGSDSVQYAKSEYFSFFC